MYNLITLFRTILAITGLTILTVTECTSDLTTVASVRRQKILGGFTVAPGELPYQVSIQAGGKHWCGGAIISDRHILTAAHCFVDQPKNTFYDERTNGPLTIVAGTTDLTDQQNSVTAEVAEFVVSNYYLNSDREYHIYDFAVMKLRTKLELYNNPKVRYIKLPDFNSSASYVGQYATVSGFGLTNNLYTGKLYWPSKLYQLVLEIWNNDYCNYILNGSLVLNENHICGYAHRNDRQLHGPCNGDSGSPLVYQYRIIGIVSGGSSDRCGEEYKPTFFTKVASWVPFIRDIMAGRYDKEMAIKRF